MDTLPERIAQKSIDSEVPSRLNSIQEIIPPRISLKRKTLRTMDLEMPRSRCQDRDAKIEMPKSRCPDRDAQIDLPILVHCVMENFKFLQRIGQDFTFVDTN